MSVRTRLILASCLMLFLELALIRWTASNIVHLGYFSNFVLLGSFLGVGIGFLRARKGRSRPYYFPVVLAALVVLILAFPVTVERSGSDLVFFTSLSTTGPPVWLVLPLVFLGVAAVLAGPGELVGACFLELPRLEAYRLDLVGSLLGIGGFTLLAFLRTPSIVWGVVVVVLIALLLLDKPSKAAVVAVPTVLVTVLPLLVMVGALFLESRDPRTSWSPYYKVVTTEVERPQGRYLEVSVNGVPHQSGTSAENKVNADPQYSLPYERTTRSDPGRTLIVGAGTGSDVALALSRGATSVDAVEIDPRLAQIGQERHPDLPYDDPRVTLHIDDGRAFLENTDQQYDTIIFALPDSLTLVAGASSLRLESYLFTVDAMRAVHDHLAPGGSFAMYNYYREPWLIGRLADTVAEGFGHAPCVDLVGNDNRAVITAGATAADQQCATTTVAAADVPDPSTDDHPFVYLKDRAIPLFYLATLAGILALSLLSVRLAGGPLRRMRPYGDLFLLGAAFLLLETRAVTSFALLFGTTWVVNALVFAGVLVVVLVAVEITRRFPTPPLPVVYALLGASLVVAALVPPGLLLGLPVGLRAVVSVLIAFAPVFFANLVFAKRFATTEDGTAAFGANLLGAMLGGCLEYLSLVVGYQGLILVAAVIYGGAFALNRGRARAPA